MATPTSSQEDLFELYSHSKQESVPMVTLFQRETAETSEEDDQLSLALNMCNKTFNGNTLDVGPSTAKDGAVGVYTDLSAISLPRVSHFKYKWLKQTVRANQKHDDLPLEDHKDLSLDNDN